MSDTTSDAADGGPVGYATPVVAACDLDRTLIFSARALGLRVPDAEAPSMLVAEVYHGEPLSFLTAEAGRLLQELAAAAVLVPTTTRTRDQYARVRLPGPQPHYAVCANGGHLLVDGRPDEDWRRQVDAALAAACAPLETITEHLRKVSDPRWTRKLRIAEDLFCYAVVQRDEMPVGLVSELTMWAETQGWTVSLQGRKLYLVPRPLTKSAAIVEVVQRVGAGRVLAAGDSLLDAELLELADAGVRPAHGELHDQGWNAPHVGVTRSSGVMAGEEITRWLLDLVR
ncbi:HAD family hydrolase [Motilibacter aurantiacus]|uniref:HAD family hydrolase n=1 Tax=Motilibacter aurantiacus TaxID=2714955 RepID=UPI00140E1881|nr:HAD family hydrolase [Motilibacter aurantiacus]NHC43686.1 HAD family hydrolase [Motilibacter aurantiacus]